MRKVSTPPRVDFDHALSPVPLTERLPLIATVLLWASLTLDPSAPYLAMGWGSAFPFGLLVVSVLAANFVLSIFSSISGYIASREGVTYALAAEKVFGRVGVTVPAVWAGIVCVGWLAFSIGVVADALKSVVGAPGFTYYPLALVLTLVFSVTAYKGVRHIVRLAMVGVPLLVLLVAVGVLVSVRTRGLPNGMLGGIELADLPLLFSLVLGTFVNGSITLSFDYQRFCRKPSHAVVTGFMNFMVFWSFIILLTAIPAAVLGADLITTYTILGLAPVAAVTLLLLAWTSADNQLYSASLSWTLACNRLGRNISRETMVLIASCAAALLALTKLHTFAVFWLTLMTSIALPAGIVVWTDYLLSRKVFRKEWGFPGKANIAAFTAWALGSITIYYTSYVVKAWYALPVGFTVTLLAYIVLSLVSKRSSNIFDTSG